MPSFSIIERHFTAILYGIYEEIASELLCNMQPSLFYQYMLISTRICINKGNLQLHPIQILRLGDVEVDLNAVAAGQGHGFDEMAGDELALCGGGGIEHLGPGKELLVLILQLLGEPVAVGQSGFQRFNIGG